MTDPKPIPWESVAVVGLVNGNAVIISSMEPRVIFDTVISLVQDDYEDDDDFLQWDEEIRADAVREKIQEIQWELYSTEDAKEVFCKRPAKADESETIKPLPGQKSLFEVAE